MANASIDLNIDLVAFQKSLTNAFTMWQATMAAMGQESPKNLQDLKAELDIIAEKVRKPMVLDADGTPMVSAIQEAGAATDVLNEKVEDSGTQAESFWQQHSKGWANFSLIYRGVMDVYNDISRVVGGMIEQQVDAQKGMARVEAAVLSTGGAAGYTAGELNGMAGSLEAAFAIDADEIMNKVTTPLLTFTQISGEAFSGAQEAIIDISRALGTGLQSSAMQVGKALNDPIRGVAALREVGVSFSEDQEEVIRKLVETGRAAEAQKLILQELSVEFGGQAAAYMETGAGKLEALKVAFDNLSESMGGLLLPVVISLGAAVKPVVEWITNMDTAFKILIPTLVLATAGWYKYAVAQTAAATVSGALTAAIGASAVALKGLLSTLGPVGWALMGITAAVTAWTVVSSKGKSGSEEFAEAQVSLKDEIAAANAEVSTQVGKFELLGDKLLELRSQSNLSDEQQREMGLTIQQINEDYGDYIGNIDLATASHVELEAALRNTSEALLAQAVAEAYGSRYKARIDEIATLTVAYNDALRAYQESRKQTREELAWDRGLGAARQAQVRINPLLEQVIAAEQQMKDAKVELEEFRKAYYGAVEEIGALFSGGEAKGGRDRSGGNGAKTGSSEDSQKQEAARLIAEMARMRQGETEQLEAEYLRRLAVIQSFLAEGSASEKAAVADLDAWKSEKQSEIDAKEQAGIQAKFEAEVGHLANLHEMGVSSYDQLKAKMAEYYEWAQKNLPANEAAMVLKQSQEINLRWGQHQKEKEDKERAHQRTLADIRREYSDRELSQEAQALNDKLAAVDRYFEDKKALMLEAGLSEAQILQAQADAELKILEDSAAQEKRLREQKMAMALSKTSGMLGKLGDMQDKESRRGFETWKAMAMAQAYVDMSSAILGAFRSQISIPILGPFLAVAEAAVAAAFGMKQIAEIKGTKYEAPKAEQGGYLEGASHAEGGVIIEAEGGEYVAKKSRVRELGRGIFDFINNGPIGAVREVFAGLAIPAIEANEIGGARYAYASGGGVDSGGGGLMGIMEAINDKMGVLVKKNVEFNIHIDPLSNDPVRVSEISDTGKLIRSEV